MSYKPDKFPSRLALSQVKGGKFNLSQLRDFIHVAYRETSTINYFISIDQVSSRDARSEAAGMKEIKIQGKSFDRMNLWSIRDYFEDRMPIMNDPYTGKPIDQQRLAL